MFDHQSMQWRPIEDIDLLGRQIAEMLAAITVQREALNAARQGSGSFDAYTLVGLTARLTVQRDELWRFDEQLRRWLTAKLNDEQQHQVQRMVEQMVRLYAMIDATLQLIGEMERSSAATTLQNLRDPAKAVTPRKRRSTSRSHDLEQP